MTLESCNFTSKEPQVAYLSPRQCLSVVMCRSVIQIMLPEKDLLKLKEEKPNLILCKTSFKDYDAYNNNTITVTKLVSIQLIWNDKIAYEMFWKSFNSKDKISVKILKTWNH